MERIYYISQGQSPEEHLVNIQKVVKSGCKLVQLRLKDVLTITYIDIAQKAQKICKQYNAVLIINDSIEVTQMSNAHGIHLGTEDTKPSIARKDLGSKFIIGGTANTMEDCINLHKQGVDYIGLGPFSFTETKQNLSPTLGIEGYNKIIKELTELNIGIPIYAIGGIEKKDIAKLIQSEIHGIAVSGLLSNLSEADTKDTFHTINNYFIVDKIEN